jgi:PTS system nitrogen regulatory IIA component
MGRAGSTSQGNEKKMDLGDLIKPEGVIASLKAKSKKQVLHDLSHKAGELTGLDERVIFETLLQRERLGSTGLGRGIAIPHGKPAGLTRITCLFARLETPIDFDATDGEPVELVFLLLAPEDAGADHLKALARISRLLRDPLAIEKLKGSRERTALHAVLTEPATSHAA